MAEAGANLGIRRDAETHDAGRGNLAALAQQAPQGGHFALHQRKHAVSTRDVLDDREGCQLHSVGISQVSRLACRSLAVTRCTS